MRAEYDFGNFIHRDSLPGPWPRRALPRHSICVWPQPPGPIYDHPEAWLDGMVRVGGRAGCPACGASYADHPGHPRWPTFGTLHVTCDGRPVKS